jgi:hypothetical protein
MHPSTQPRDTYVDAHRRPTLSSGHRNFLLADKTSVGPRRPCHHLSWASTTVDTKSGLAS